MALDYGSNVALLGFTPTKTPIPYGLMVFKKLSLRGRFMSERHTFTQLIRMVEAGIVKLGKPAGIKVIGTFGLHQLEEAMTLAEKKRGWSEIVALTPFQEGKSESRL